MAVFSTLAVGFYFVDFLIKAKGVYDAVAIECKKIEEQGARTASKFSSLAYLCGGLIPYVQVKSLMIDLYPFCSKFKLF